MVEVINNEVMRGVGDLTLLEKLCSVALLGVQVDPVFFLDFPFFLSEEKFLIGVAIWAELLVPPCTEVEGRE